MDPGEEQKSSTEISFNIAPPKREIKIFNESLDEFTVVENLPPLKLTVRDFRFFSAVQSGYFLPSSDPC